MSQPFAYLDLASGSMIVQAVIASIVVVPVLFRNKLRALLGREAVSLDEARPDARQQPEPTGADEGVAGVVASVFRLGATAPDRVGLDDALVRGLGERELLWVDMQLDPRQQGAALRSVDQVMRLGGALVAAAASSGISVRFAEETVRLTVNGLADADDGPPRLVSLHLVAAPNRVVSVHTEPIRRLSEPIEVVAADPRFGRLDAGTFLGLLLDGALDGYFAEVERIERRIDDLDTRSLRSDEAGALLDDLVEIRRRVADLRRAVAPQREVFAALVRPVEDPELSPIGWPWPGLPDRLERLLDAIENAREEMLGTFDIVMTRVGQRTNDTMRVLTVVSAVLLPSVVIAGVMGMNFKIPFFDDPRDFLVVVAAMFALAVVILGLARRRHWI